MQTCSCIKHAHACMPKHINTPTHTQCADSAIYLLYVRHTTVHTDRHTFLVLRSKIRCLQLCPSFLHDLKLSVLSAPDIHTNTCRASPINSLCFKRTHMHTNESHGGNYRAEPFMLAGYQMFSSPHTILC